MDITNNIQNKDKSISTIDDGLIELVSIFEPEEVERIYLDKVQENPDQLFETCKIVGKALGITIIKPQFTSKNLTQIELLESIIEASGIRMREINLIENWQMNDCGPLLGFRRENADPIALIRENGKYYLVDSKLKTKQMVDEQITKSLSETAYQFYKTLPDVPLNWRHLFFFVFGDLKKDIKNILILQLYAGLLALLIPIVTGLIFENIIPNADKRQLGQLTILLVLTTLVSIAFGLVQSFALMRIRFKSNVNMQAAVWDRVLKLPLPFFRQFISGDLANRARGIDTIQQFLTSTTITSILSGTFSILSLFLMFYYDVWLSLAATVLGIIAVVISLLFNRIQLKYQRPLLDLQGKISGIVFQLLTSINKLRVAHSEKQAFAHWAKFFSKKNILFKNAQMNVITFGIFYPFFVALSTIVLYSIVVARGNNLSFGHFVAFNAAFGQFMSAILSMASIVNSSLMIAPLYERVKPILLATPEIGNMGVNPGPLKGNINVQNVTFRYQKDSIIALENVSLEIEEGAFVALVGPTGSGKSTLFRLLLGFEEIEKDKIFYDSHDLISLNKKAVRKQMGVVSQNSMLLPGSIYENITNFSPCLILTEAENAAKLMQILDEIQTMPMGMHTLISEGSRNISVGQRQRILLARAIIHQPKILLLDEATSSLDNVTQALIYEQLETLKMTKIVAAHRLSTIKKADRIYVLEHGMIVQQGNYAELIKKPGLFAEMAKRQIL